MTEIEKMQRYIDRTKMGLTATNPYQMNTREAFELAFKARECGGLPLEVITFAFHYGQAKGYRMAKAERRARG